MSENQETKKKEERLELWIAIFLGITALLTAWATWIGSLHGGNQATNYAKSNNLSAEGNSMYNEAAQNYMQDMLLWNQIMEYEFDYQLAMDRGDDNEAKLIEDKIQILKDDNCTEEFREAVDWSYKQDGLPSPFTKEGYTDSYYTAALEKLDEAQAVLEEGQNDNRNGDRYGLVTVIFSLVLFLLGIVGIFKKLPNRVLVFGISVVFLIGATIFMCTIPMPTGFSFFGYFS
ncbi:MAG: hypothetical protein K6G62_08635 [Eubacterium sp.]|nr:hypothetical protein [Eubacterium sp.]